MDLVSNPKDLLASKIKKNQAQARQLFLYFLFL
jgi:hypothetical protein